MVCPFFPVLPAVTLESWHWSHCYSSWTNLCWKQRILTSQHGLLQLSSQRASTNAQCFFSKTEPPDRTYPSLFVVNFQVANLKSSPETYTTSRLISSPAQLEHMFWVCVCVCVGVGHIYRVFQKDLNSGHRGHRTWHPLIFFLWGYVKDNAYKPPLPQNVTELQDRIRAAVQTIDGNKLVSS